MNGYNWNFIVAAYGEAKAFGRLYGGEQYWRTLRIDLDWLRAYDMGGEL